MGIAFIELSKRVVEALSFKQFVKRNYIIDYLFFVSFSWILLLPLLLTVLLTPCTSRLLYILLLDSSTKNNALRFVIFWYSAFCWCTS